ncbi:MAG: nucleotide exchange factor GrpE [Solirubrobacterales bacterium]|nr:nucleotide exchange factor GrpE [Solirubrobacterales bacterium]
MSHDHDEQIDEEFLVANTPGAEPAPGVDAVSDEPVVDAEVVDEGEAAEASVEQDLNSLVEQARNERDEYLDLAQRTKADFDNYRKRMAAETTAARGKGKLDVAAGLIETVDNLERVLAAEEIDLETANAGSLPADAPVSLQGIIVVYRDLNNTLRKAGVEGFDPSGEAFDPTFHEALQAVPAEGVEPGIVLEMMQRGYRSGDAVIRPARVVVSQ